MSDAPPPQRDDAWLGKATPEQIYDAHQYGELAVLEGHELDEDGWPVGSNGRRLSLKARPR